MIAALAQDQNYHTFADARAFLGIGNAADTLSNLPFLIVGALGLLFLWREHSQSPSQRFVVGAEMRAYWILFGAIALTAFGSAYYHQAPDDARLMWDRLPMSFAFTALLAATVAERIRLTWGLHLLFPLVILGAGSVAYWRWTGNLLPYAIAQFGSIAAILAVVILFRSRYTQGSLIFAVLAIYALAKVAEVFDARIYTLGHIVSGHTLKHLLAAAASCLLLRMLQSRRPLT